MKMEFIHVKVVILFALLVIVRMIKVNFALVAKQN